MQRRAGLVGRARAQDPQLVGLPQLVDELGEAALAPAGLQRTLRPVLGRLDDRGDAQQQVQHGPAAGLGGVGREDRAQLQPAEDLLGRALVQVPRPQGLAEPLEGAVQAAGRGAGELQAAVQLLGGVGELEVGGEGAGEVDRGGVVDARQQRGQVGTVVGAAGQLADLLDEVEQLAALVPREGLPEEFTELADRRPQRGVPLVGGDPVDREHVA